MGIPYLSAFLSAMQTEAVRHHGSQVADAQFAAEPVGCYFRIRKPLAKVNARKCADCGRDIFDHSRSEVDDQDVLTILDVVADSKASVILEGLYMGGFKAALAEAKVDDGIFVLNCAGQMLHTFLPLTRAPFDRLRKLGGFLIWNGKIARAFRFIQMMSLQH